MPLYLSSGCTCSCVQWRFVMQGFLSTIVQQDLKQHHLWLPEAAALTQNRHLWRMILTYGATQS